MAAPVAHGRDGAVDPSLLELEAASEEHQGHPVRANNCPSSGRSVDHLDLKHARLVQRLVQLGLPELAIYGEHIFGT